MGWIIISAVIALLLAMVAAVTTITVRRRGEGEGIINFIFILPGGSVIKWPGSSQTRN